MYYVVNGHPALAGPFGADRAQRRAAAPPSTSYLPLLFNWAWNGAISNVGTAIIRLRNAGISQRKLALIAGCSEGLMRHLEIVGRMPYAWKRFLEVGYSTRAVVGWWRQEQRQELEAA
jgi:hypothetical protein